MRQDHFMGVHLVSSQVSILEEPENAIVANIDQTIDAIVQHIKYELTQGKRI
jgi:gluconate kinase